MTDAQPPSEEKPLTDIAVIIVTYRSASLTIESLRSLAAERSTPGLRIRAVVVDNASGDVPAVSQAIQTHNWSSWVTLLLAPRNGGFAYGNNLGLRHAYLVAKPDYVYLLNPDTKVRPGAVGTLVTFLDSHGNAGIAGSGIEGPDGTDWPIAFRFPTLLSELNDGLQFGLASSLLRRWIVPKVMSKKPEEIDWVCGASMMVRATVIDAIGGLDENYFLYFEETDFCYRAKRSGFATWYVPDSRVMHVRGQSTNLPELGSSPQRLPGYWFESRRRYFTVTGGVRYAVMVDIVALIAHSLGSIKRAILGRRGSGVRHFLRDLIRHSSLWPRNRQLPPSVAFFRGADPGTGVQ
ncbi:MAG: glycosyltransferase family 2 protein [Steroidobacteraceae bacterium]